MWKKILWRTVLRSETRFKTWLLRHNFLLLRPFPWDKVGDLELLTLTLPPSLCTMLAGYSLSNKEMRVLLLLCFFGCLESLLHSLSLPWTRFVVQEGLELKASLLLTLSPLGAGIQAYITTPKRFHFQGLNTNSQNAGFCVSTMAESNFGFHAKGILLLLFLQTLLFLWQKHLETSTFITYSVCY